MTHHQVLEEDQQNMTKLFYQMPKASKRIAELAFTNIESVGWSSESRDISSRIIFADLQPVLSEVEV